MEGTSRKGPREALEPGSAYRGRAGQSRGVGRAGMGRRGVGLVRA